MTIEVFIWLSFPIIFFRGFRFFWCSVWRVWRSCEKPKFQVSLACRTPYFQHPPIIITMNHYKSPLIIMNHHRIHFCWRDHVMPRCLPLAELTRPNIAFQTSTSALKFLSPMGLARREVGNSINRGTPIAGWFLMENSINNINMDDLGVPPF